MQLDGKVVWITGASDGIGAELAVVMSGRGAKVVLTARRAEKLEEVASRCSGETFVLPADLLQADAQDLATKAAEAFGPVDVLVANAGRTQRGKALDTTLAATRQLMELNFFVPVALAKAVVPGMVERGMGWVVVTSSVAGHIGTPDRSTYSASKFAIEGYFESLRAELHGTGVGVSIVAPGYVATDIARAAMSEDGSDYGRDSVVNAKGRSPAQVGEVMARAIERERAHVLIGGREVAAVYLKRLSPALVRRFLPGAGPVDRDPS